MCVCGLQNGGDRKRTPQRTILGLEFSFHVLYRNCLPVLYLQGPTINILSQERNNYDRWSQKDSRTTISRHPPVMTGLQSLSEKATGSKGGERERV